MRSKNINIFTTDYNKVILPKLRLNGHGLINFVLVLNLVQKQQNKTKKLNSENFPFFVNLINGTKDSAKITECIADKMLSFFSHQRKCKRPKFPLPPYKVFK